jgi:hypothetical protein
VDNKEGQRLSEHNAVVGIYKLEPEMPPSFPASSKGSIGMVPISLMVAL